MPADLSIPFQLCRTLKYILPGEDTVSSEPAPDLDQRTLQTLFPLQCFIINEQVHLVESVILMDSIGNQTKPAEQKPVVSFLIKGLKEAGRNSTDGIRFHRGSYLPVMTPWVKPSVEVKGDIAVTIGADFQ